MRASTYIHTDMYAEIVVASSTDDILTERPTKTTTTAGLYAPVSIQSQWSSWTVVVVVVAAVIGK